MNTACNHFNLIEINSTFQNDIDDLCQKIESLQVRDEWTHLLNMLSKISNSTVTKEELQATNKLYLSRIRFDSYQKLQDRINYIKHMLESSLISNDLPHIIQCSYNAYSNIYKIIQPLRDRSR